jgi:hypothetical protein
MNASTGFIMTADSKSCVKPCESEFVLGMWYRYHGVTRLRTMLTFQPLQELQQEDSQENEKAYNRDPVHTGETAEAATLNQAFSGKTFYGKKILSLLR